MPDETAPTCVDPFVGRFLSEAISGELRAENREADRKRFEAHMKQCPKCRRAMVDHLNESVTIPALRQFAQEKGLAFEDVLAAFRQGVEGEENEK